MRIRAWCGHSIFNGIAKLQLFMQRRIVRHAMVLLFISVRMPEQNLCSPSGFRTLVLSFLVERSTPELRELDIKLIGKHNMVADLFMMYRKPEIVTHLRSRGDFLTFTNGSESVGES